MYRPEGWNNPLTKARLLAEHNDFNIVDEAFEAGADAMLEGLKKTSIYKVPIPKGKRIRPLSLDGTKGKYGWLVFIPEEG